MPRPTDPRALARSRRNRGHHFSLERLHGGRGGSTTTERIAAEEQAERERAAAILQAARDELMNRSG